MEWIVGGLILFQSPLSGQICLNVLAKKGLRAQNKSVEFQSPLSGQICLNRVV